MAPLVILIWPGGRDYTRISDQVSAVSNRVSGISKGWPSDMLVPISPKGYAENLATSRKLKLTADSTPRGPDRAV
jgi:hypothetical protein